MKQATQEKMNLLGLLAHRRHHQIMALAGIDKLLLWLFLSTNIALTFILSLNCVKVLRMTLHALKTARGRLMMK